MKKCVNTKKLIYVIFALLCASAAAVCLRLVAGAVGAFAYSNSGKAATVKHISTLAEFFQISIDVNDGLYDGYYGTEFLLDSDIDLDGAEWTPIGTALYPFKGTFDGQGYAVKGLKVVSADSYCGLFGFAAINANIKNLTVYGEVNGTGYAGGIAGYNKGSIENCKNYCGISAGNDCMHIGGIVGYNDGNLAGSLNYGTISAGLSIFIGGVTGSNYGTVEKCANTGEIVTAGSVVGGITGLNSDSAYVSVVLNGGDVSAKTISGGICGNNRGFVSNVFNSGAVVSDNGTAGGITGSNEVTGTVEYALTVAVVSGREDIAALCGYNTGIIKYSYFNSDSFKGATANGISAEDSEGFPSYILGQEDVLYADGKLNLLTENNANIWAKRAYTADKFYYPEPEYFYVNTPTVSALAAEAKRIIITEEEVALDCEKFIYNGEERTTDIAVNGIKLEEGQDFTVVYSDNVNAGTADIKLTFINAYCGTVLKNFKIEKAELSVMWDRLQFTYNGKEQAPVLNVTAGPVKDETVTFEYEREKSVRAGKYSVKATLVSNTVNANYFLPKTEIGYDILAAEISIGWTDEYFVYNGGEQLPTAYVTDGRIDEENITFRYEYEDVTVAGEHVVTAYLENTEVNGNYAFFGERHFYVIHRQPVAVEWQTTPLYYNGLPQYPYATLSQGGVGEEVITFEYSEYEDNIAANEDGGYFVKLNLADTRTNANYYFEPEIHNYKILKNPVEIQWYETALEYNGTAQYPAFYIVAGRIGEDEILFEISDYSKNIAASSGEAYVVTVKLADNAVNANYVFEPTDKRYDIGKARFNPRNVVEFLSQTFAYDGTEKSIAVSGKLPEGITAIYKNNGQTEIGEYIIEVKFVADENNYLPVENDTLTVSMYIAQTEFSDGRTGITVRNIGEAIYGLNLEVTDKDSGIIKKRGKKTAAVYGIGFTYGAVEISVPLTNNLSKMNGLKVLYRNSAGELVETDYKIKDGKIIFSAEDVTEFALVGDVNLLPLWIVLGVIPLVAAAAVIFGITFKRRIKQICVAELPAVTENAISDATEENAVEYAADVTVSEKPFMLDGIYCASLKWFILSLNFKNVQKQKLICGGNADAAKLYEAIPRDTAYWCGKRYNKNSEGYYELIKRAEEATNEAD